MTPQFTPKGEKPEWLMIYDELLDDADSGRIISYAELDTLLGRDFKSNRTPLYRARTELGDRRKHWLEAVPQIGYRIIDAAEHVRISTSHKRRGRRQLGLAVRVLAATDLSKLTGSALDDWDQQQKLTFALWAVFAHESRLRKIEDVLRKEGLM